MIRALAAAVLAALLAAAPPGAHATPRPQRRASAEQGAHSAAAARRAALRHDALALLGVRYRRGGASPRTGFDCSGLVKYVFAEAAGIALPHSARALSRAGRRVARRRLRTGDLVFFHTRRARYSHVGIYIGHGRFIHAPRPGGRVRISSLRDPYWSAHYSGARRLALGRQRPPRGTPAAARYAERR